MFTNNTERFLNPLRSNFNYKKADWSKFEKSLQRNIKDREIWKKIKDIESQLFTSPLSPPSLNTLSPLCKEAESSLCKQAEDLAICLTSCLKKATSDSVPRSRQTEFSKP